MVIKVKTYLVRIDWRILSTFGLYEQGKSPLMIDKKWDHHDMLNGSTWDGHEIYASQSRKLAY